MPLTVLFDLDDTLLNTNVETFFPAYMRALAKALPGEPSTDKFRRQLFYAESKMVTNPDPGKMLSQVFSENFYHSLGTTEEACRPILHRFYSELHPTLHNLKQPKEGARELIDWCQAHGMTLAVATNPVFPDIATRQRIQWAGLDPEEFAFYTTYNNSHFAKPSLAYYAEILGRLGWPDAPVVMIGDDLNLDLLPTEKMGFSTFWINSNGHQNHRPKGNLFDAKKFLQKCMANREFHISNDPEVLIAILRSTPAVIDTWFTQFPTDALNNKPDKKDQPFVDVLWQMARIEQEIYLPQWEQLSLDPKQTLILPDLKNWAKDRERPDHNPEKAFDIFVSFRQKSLELIEDLLDKAYVDQQAAKSTHSETAFEQLLDIVAKSDRTFLRECANILGI